MVQTCCETARVYIISKMNLFTILLCALLLTRCLVFSYHVSSTRENPEGRIVGGHQAAPHSHPYMVSLQLRFLWIRSHICGGTLLNDRWVLTAAHCVTDSFLIRWLNMDAVAGAHDVDYYGPTAQVNKVVRRIPNPDYTGGVGPNDIAVLKTEDKFIFTKEIQPIRMPSDVDLGKGTLILPGWGVLRTTFFIPDLPSKLQELKVTYVPYEKCNENIDKLLENGERNPLDKEANICTGPLGGGTAACSGDSGGPLVLQLPSQEVEDITQEINDNETDESVSNNYIETDDDEESSKDMKEDKFDSVVVGVVSWGVSPCGEKGAPTVFTNVSRYNDFINKHINT